MPGLVKLFFLRKNRPPERSAALARLPSSSDCRRGRREAPSAKRRGARFSGMAKKKKGGGGKKKNAGPSGKSINRAKDRIVADKTFGLKNKKKSKKVPAPAPLADSLFVFTPSDPSDAHRARARLFFPGAKVCPAGEK